jgi:DNA polymerase alpha subunit B
MYTSLEERAAMLERQLLEMQEELAKRHHLKEISPVSTPSQEIAVVVGRICCEAASGKLNKTAVMLEGSLKDSGGMRIKLDLQEVPLYALFPGQIVAVEGINSTGRRMVAKKIYSSVPAESHRTLGSRLADFQHDSRYLGGSPLTMLCAAGPFTTNNNLDYQPLKDMLSVSAKLQPDVLLLVGPFIDCDHPEVASGELSVDLGGEMCEITHKEFFMMRVQSEIEKLLKDSKVEPKPKVVLIPSLNDIHHDFVYPQPPFRFDHDFDVPDAKDVVFMSNPATFCVNEVTVGVNASDILMHLGPEEISRVGKVSGGRLGRLADHCINQHSFYPLFPATSGNAQLDLRHYKKYAMQKTPDILITPSKLAHFVKKGDPSGTGTTSNISINPGQLTKGNNGGTFARFTVHPIPQRTLDDRSKAELPHDIANRTRVEIIRI